MRKDLCILDAHFSITNLLVYKPFLVPRNVFSVERQRGLLTWSL